MALLLLACCTAALRLRAAAALDTERGLIERGQYKDAISQLDKAVAQAPANAEAMALLLQARLETGDYRKAFEQGQEFLKR